jgi:putative copper resistance protein D
VAAYLDVVLRGLILAGQAAAIGGIAFALVVLRGAVPGRVAGLTAAGAGAVALAQAAALALQVAALADEGGFPLADVADTAFFRVSAVRIAVALVLFAAAVGLRRRAPTRARLALLAAAAAGLAVAAAFTSHAAARVTERALPLAFDALHQLAASVWVGGLIHLVATTLARRAPIDEKEVLPRFSAMALGAVATLLASAGALTWLYVDGLAAMTGTAYGLMVLTKAVILGGLLAFGSLNFFAVRRLRSGETPPPRMRRFVEVEVGLGLSVLFAAASLTSLPPAVDVVPAERATLGEVAYQFEPRPPRVVSPRHEELPAGDRWAPRTDADRAWSEYNHNMAGIFVVTMGVLAMISRRRWGRWARHWPLVFLGLAVFLFFRDDPGAWPLGPEGFWASMTNAEVLQHRVFVALVVAFGVFEWMVRTERVRAAWTKLVFPVLCAVGGALLLTHSHGATNLKTEFLVEVTHAPLGVFGMAAGWGRWLELRLSPPDDRLPGRLWPVAFTLVGALLLIYHES